MTTLLNPELPTIACDVDGPVAAMIPSFVEFTKNEFGVEIDISKIAYHDRMGRSPGLQKQDLALRRYFPSDSDPDSGGIGGAFQAFMKDRDVYGKYVSPTPGAVDAFAHLRPNYNIIFVTALMRSARDHFRSKMEWLERWFPGHQIVTCPSGLKHHFIADYCIDDRWDTCNRWESIGTTSLLFSMPWSEVPSHKSVPLHNWSTITGTLLR